MIGTQSNPVAHAEPAKIANALLQSHFRTPNNQSGLWTHQGIHYVWEGHRWIQRDRDWLRDACWTMMEDIYVTKLVNGIPVASRYGVDQNKINNVMEAMCAKTRLPYGDIPVWLGSSDMDASRCITFEDKVVHVGRETEVVDRDESWFCTSVIPCEYQEDAECPTWMACIDQWSGGDPEWIELLQRWFGYCLLPHNDYARWFLMYGKVRSGKGTIAKILESLLGLDSYFGVSLYSLSNRFGLDGLQGARVMCVHEVSELDGREGERCVQVLKSILGQDRIDIDRKGLPMIRNVTIPAKAMMQTNEVPKLPNKGQGLSSKMLVLPFDVSFHGKEDERLIHKLRQELPGIAAWAVKGAEKVENAGSSKERFVVPSRSADAIRLYLQTNNPFDSFLQARFVQNDNGFVATEVVWNQWLDWVEKNKVRGQLISRNQITVKIEQESSWNVQRHRPNGGKRGLKGMVLRNTYDDEV